MSVVVQLGAQAPEPLFAEAAVDAPLANQPALPASYLVRSRTVRFRPAAFDAAVQSPQTNSFTLNLFDDATFAVAFERTEVSGLGHRTWSGHIAGRPLTTVTLTRKDDILVGAVMEGTTRYEIAAHGGGVVRIDQLDTTAMPRTRDEALPVPSSAAAAPQPAPRDPAAPAATPGADVLIYYSTGVRGQAGGTAQAEAMAARFVAEANTAYARSGVNGLVRLLAALEVPAPDGANADALLSALRSHPLPQSHRDLGGVDLVALLTTHFENPGNGFIQCGLAYIGPASEFAYSAAATRSECRAIYAFAHEIGHNLGAQHATEDGVATGPQYPTYARAFKAPNHAFRTVVAYECTTFPACPPVLNFSNPGVAGPGGQPTGTGAQNNARRLNELFATVASYRPSRVPPSPPQSLQGSASGSTVTLAWLPPAAGGAPSDYLIDAGTAPGLSNLVSGLPYGETSLMAPGIPPGRYFLRVRARNGAGVSGFSNEVVITVQ